MNPLKLILFFSIISTLLLNEIKGLETLTISNSDSLPAEIKDEQQTLPHPTQIVIPVFAKKAGGHLKPELVKNLQNLPLPSTSPSIINISSNKVDGNGEISKQIEKALSNETPEEVETSLKSSKDKVENVVEYGYEEYEEEEEPECPESQFWHIRGRNCVPQRCSGGNHWRDVNTGECILRRYGKRRGKRRWNPYGKNYWSSKH